MRVLLSTLPQMGHIVPGAVLKHALEQRGHFVAWEICPTKEQTPALLDSWFERFQEAAPRQEKALLSRLQSDDFDLLITDPCILAGWSLHEKIGTPWAIFSNLPIFYVDKRVPLFLQASLPEFEPFRASNIYFIGPVLPTDITSPDKLPSFRHMRNFKKKIIGITQGTVATNPEDLIKIAKMAVDGTMYLVDKYFNYAHHMNLLDVFITNGGFGSVQMAIYHGVPIIVSGKTEDKPYVGKRVEEMGVGINLKPPITQGELKNAIIECLYNKEIRETCKEMAQKCRSYSIYQAVDALEKLAFDRYPISAFGS